MIYVDKLSGWSLARRLQSRYRRLGSGRGGWRPRRGRANRFSLPGSLRYAPGVRVRWLQPNRPADRDLDHQRYPGTRTDRARHRLWPGPMGADSTYAQIAANRLGHLAIDNGIGGGHATMFNAASYPSSVVWTRLLDPNTGNILGSTIPDYAVIDLCINDAVQTGSLATFQAQYQQIIATLKSIVITGIICLTGPMGQYAAGGLALPTFMNGQLQTTIIASGSLTSIVVAGNPYPTFGVGSLAFSGKNAGAWFQVSAAWTNSNKVFLELPNSGYGEGRCSSRSRVGEMTEVLTTRDARIAELEKLLEDGRRLASVKPLRSRRGTRPRSPSGGVKGGGKNHGHRRGPTPPGDPGIEGPPPSSGPGRGGGGGP